MVELQNFLNAPRTTSNLVVLHPKSTYKRTPKLESTVAHPFAEAVWLTPRNTPLPRVALPNLVVLGQTVQALLRRSSEKFDPSRPAFQGHSRSSEPTWLDRLPTTFY